MDKKKQIYRFIQSEVAKRGLPPTIREIGKRFGISSTNGVRYFLERLESDGLIRRQNRTARGISISRSADIRARRVSVADDSASRQAVFASHPKSNGSLSGRPADAVRTVPILGRVPAGRPVVSEENIEGTLLLDGRLARGYEVFAVKVNGDSMIGAGINDGDIAVVKKDLNPQAGDLVVALLDDEVTLKRFTRKGKSLILKPENDNYPEIDLSALSHKEIRMLGTVIAIVRKY
jgi:repressor LexA